MNIIGNAPCVCGYFHHEIKLTGKSEDDGKGGEWFECVEGQSCPDCGEPLRWMHQPAPEDLRIPQLESVKRISQP